MAASRRFLFVLACTWILALIAAPRHLAAQALHVIEDGSDAVVGALLAQGLMVSSRSTEACFVFGGPEVTDAAEKLGCASRVLDAEADGWEHYLVEGGASSLGALPTVPPAR